ncbi:hypothetical protein Pfo_010340 [Paulownia fortunei]|nr:hypothetical protein Pfo_010340 [Paulownia fortunei]
MDAQRLRVHMSNHEHSSSSAISSRDLARIMDAQRLRVQKSNQEHSSSSAISSRDLARIMDAQRLRVQKSNHEHNSSSAISSRDLARIMDAQRLRVQKSNHGHSSSSTISSRELTRIMDPQRLRVQKSNQEQNSSSAISSCELTRIMDAQRLRVQKSNHEHNSSYAISSRELTRIMDAQRLQDSQSELNDCYKHYKLGSSGKLFTCHGCRMGGLGERYQCEPCGKELHKECRFPTRTTSHDYFGCSTFTFLVKPITRLDKNNRKEYSKCCDACGKDICGFSYHCETDNLDLHPCCLNLEKKLVIKDTVFDLRAKVSSKCIWCENRKISDEKRNVPGWSYVSTCNKYHFHVYCMTEMIHEACIKNGEKGLEKVELRNLVKPSGNIGSGASIMFLTIKPFLKVIMSALLGDPTLMISHVFVELVSLGLQ